MNTPHHEDKDELMCRLKGINFGELDRSGPDSDITMSCAVLSTWAYSDAETLKRVFESMYGSPVKVEELHVTNAALLIDTNVYFVQDEQHNAGFLVFRGTEYNNLVDVLTDLAIDPLEFPPNSGGKVHGGFLRGMLAAYEPLIEMLEKAIEGPNRLQHLFITGHSLGGALAVLFAAQLICMQSRKSAAWAQLSDCMRGVYTFGQPLIGDKTFAKNARTAFGDRMFRFVYQKDYVAVLPPLSTGKFEHFGQEFVADRGEAWTKSCHPRKQVLLALNTAPIAAAALVARQISYTRRLSLPFSFADHIPQNYVDVSRPAYAGGMFP